jgi:site-specific recombinase XerD
VRDRAILELLYSSGLRSCEIIGLNVGDVDLHTATAKVTGKGGKERVVPIGRSALRWLETYVRAIRPFVMRHDPGKQACSSVAGARACCTPDFASWSTPTPTGSAST